MEQEKTLGRFDATCPEVHVPCPMAGKGDVRSGVRKRPPKHNKALKEAERAALQKPLTPKMYRQMIKDHLEILPFMFQMMDKDSSS